MSVLKEEQENGLLSSIMKIVKAEWIFNMMKLKHNNIYICIYIMITTFDIYGNKHYL